ncbi:MAG: aspartate/tyrosine/aromatic aminotransferase [Parachlamydia sp.]|nr:aspartate/tyrosine/aromatic aminotransferase [Parachlamydia sp.]
MPSFDKITLLPEDPIFSLYSTFQNDPRPHKVNLAIGIYQDESGRVPLLECVRQAEEAIVKSAQPKSYLPIDGHPEMIRETLELVYGSIPDNTVSMQVLGGTSGLRVGAEFLKSQGLTTIFLPEPSWPNHIQIFEHAGLSIAFYPYYDAVSQSLDFSGLRASVLTMPPDSILLLQVCCHNPTGMDLTLSQWQELEGLIKQKRLFPFFDFAYQGFGKGIEEDAEPVRLFARQGHPMMVSSSFSKNFGLYGERVGLLSIVNAGNIHKIASHMKVLIRSSYSNPPRHGASLVAEVLKTPELKKMWAREVLGMRQRLSDMRQGLLTRLKGKDRLLNALSQQQGLFFLSGLDSGKVRRLRDDFALYLLENGRLNIAGLNPGDLDRVAKALDSVL